MKGLVWSGASSHPLPHPHCCAPLPSLRLCQPGCSWTTGSLCCSAATEAWEREPQRRHPLPHSPSSFPQPRHRCNHGTHITGARSRAEKSQLRRDYTTERERRRESEYAGHSCLRLDFYNWTYSFTQYHHIGGQMVNIGLCCRGGAHVDPQQGQMPLEAAPLFYFHKQFWLSARQEFCKHDKSAE